MDQAPVHLTRAGVSLVLAPTPAGSPTIRHWGAGLGDLGVADLEALVSLQTPGVPHSALDAPRQRAIVGENVSGFTGAPALEGFRPGGGAPAWAPRLRDWTWQVDLESPDAGVSLRADDPEAGWGVALDIELTRDGLVRLRTSVTNTGPGRLELTAVRCALPVAARATELLDLTGRWCRERSPQRRAWHQGTHLRESRHGRTGHDATLILVAGTPAFGFGHGEVWATHVAWSGDQTAYAERTAEGECLLGGGELLGPGEVGLGEGETYQSPWLVGSYAACGLDAMSARLHAWTRRQGARTSAPRRVLVNTWEAVYFDHDLARLTALADAAAEVGAERFVLDDGWFRGRRHDRAGLGDWVVDEEVWPDGLHPIVDHVHALGLDFGLWVEPEMVNEDSDLARDHPGWMLRGRADLPPGWRHQQVLDLQVPEAYAHVRDALLSLLGDYDIAFLKWDHNRDLVDVGHAARPAVHGQTVAFYRLLDELRAAHPELEIESCASGGGRIDLEVLTRTERVWPSDTIDATERQQIQRWTSLLVPPEMMGTHLGGPIAHTTGRSHRLGFRAATALLGHFGIEWDLTSLAPAERREVAAWVGLHQELRPVVAVGRMVRGDHLDPALSVSGVVADDSSGRATQAWYVVATVDSITTQAPLPLVLPGLDPERTYTLRDRTPPGEPSGALLAPAWLGGAITVRGSVLTSAGIQLPVLLPESALVLEVRAVDAEGGRS